MATETERSPNFVERFAMEHPDATTLLVGGGVVLAVYGGLSLHYEDDVVDPLKEKMTCVVDYADQYGQQASDGLVVVDLAAQPPPPKCGEAIYEAAGQEDEVFTSQDYRVVDITKVRKDLEGRLANAKDDKAEHIAWVEARWVLDISAALIVLAAVKRRVSQILDKRPAPHAVDATRGTTTAPKARRISDATIDQLTPGNLEDESRDIVNELADEEASHGGSEHHRATVQEAVARGQTADQALGNPSVIRTDRWGNERPKGRRPRWSHRRRTG